MTQIEIIIRMNTRTVALRIGDRGGTLIEVELNVGAASALARELLAAVIKLRTGYPKGR